MALTGAIGLCFTGLTKESFMAKRLQKTFISPDAHKRNLRRIAEPVARAAKPLRRVANWLIDSAAVVCRGNRGQAEALSALAVVRMCRLASAGQGATIAAVCRRLNA